MQIVGVLRRDPRLLISDLEASRVRADGVDMGECMRVFAEKRVIASSIVERLVISSGIIPRDRV